MEGRKKQIRFLCEENNHLLDVLKEARDMLVLCTLLDMSGRVSKMVDKIDMELNLHDTRGDD